MSEMSAMNKRRVRDLAERISKNVEHLNKSETECLIREFYVVLGEKVTPGKEPHGLDRWKLRVFLFDGFGMTDDLMLDGVFTAFDKDKDGFISLEEWIEGLSVFLRGTLKEKIKHCFRVYDLDGEGSISREEMFHFLKDSISRDPTEMDPNEGVNLLVDIAMKRLDADGDGLVTLEEFEAAVNKEELCLQIFGTCLPNATSVEKFEQRVFRRN